LTPINSRVQQTAVAPSVVPLLAPAAEIYQALVLGTGDYVRKNGFGEVVIGLSGGIDSALTAAIATDALGPENVVGVFMPSRYYVGRKSRGCNAIGPGSRHSLSDSTH